jgi:hypothetical protein
LIDKIYSQGIPGKIRKHAKNVYIVQYSCRRGLNLAERIYKNEDIHIDRKFQQYKIALAHQGVAMSHEKILHNI